MNRRHLAASIASRLRLTSLLERVGSRPSLAVLVYHRIMKPDGHRYDKDVIEATPESFDEQLTMLRKRYAVVAPDELEDLVERPKTIRGLRVAITFDDAYRDNYTNAFPILRSHGFRATFFMPTQYIGTRTLPWWDQVAYVVRETKKPRLELRYPEPITVDRSDIEVAVRQVLRAFTRAKEADLTRYLASVEESCEMSMPTEAADREFMSWEEASEMEQGGMRMGSHTHSHSILSQLSDADQLRECTVSRERLQERKLSASMLAYPVGKPTAFSPTTMRCAEDAGYRCAFSNYGGINAADEIKPFDVKRIGMPIGEPLSQLRFRLAFGGAMHREPW